MCRGHMVITYPIRLNSTIMFNHEWQEKLWLRYNHAPLVVPQHYDRCRAKMTVERALSCKKGGLVHIRHDNAANEWRHLCDSALLRLPGPC